MLLRDRARDRDAPCGARLDGLRERPPHRVDRRSCRAGLPDAGSRRHRRGLDEGSGGRRRGGRGSGRRARQQRRLQPVGSARDGAAGADQGAVRDNVFGLVCMCQLVLPGMRRQGAGRIVNVSSMGGRMAFPGGGAYHGTKYAVEAISDTLRFELRGFGVEVVLIEPGLIKTRFGETAVGSIDAAALEGGDPYADFNAAVGAATEGAYEGPLARLGG